MLWGDSRPLGRRAEPCFQMGTWPWFGGAESHADEGRSGPGGWSGGRVVYGGGNNEDSPQGMMPFYHEPILLEEIMDYLQVAEGKRYLDVTLGGGGHSEGILQRGGHVIGLDQDPGAIAHATARLRGFATRFCALRGNFRDFPEMLQEIGVDKFDGIVGDLGISSRQLDDPAKGFSFMHDGPLDLRMNPDADMSAADLINSWSFEDILKILIEFGEEPQARRIARAIVDERTKRPIETTKHLADVVSSVCFRKGHRHPATLTFQALRIAANDELGALVDFLDAAPRWLKPGGRIAILSFHSLEDRLVKRAFQRFSAPEIDKKEWPAPKPNPEFCLSVITKKPVEPSEEEVKRNPRSRSARLRVAEKLPMKGAHS